MITTTIENPIITTLSLVVATMLRTAFAVVKVVRLLQVQSRTHGTVPTIQATIIPLQYSGHKFIHIGTSSRTGMRIQFLVVIVGVMSAPMDTLTDTPVPRLLAFHT